MQLVLVKCGVYQMRKQRCIRDRVCNLFLLIKIDYFDYEKESNRFFRFIATCKSVIRNNKSILAINALLICQRLPRLFQVCPFFIMARKISFSSLIQLSILLLISCLCQLYIIKTTKIVYPQGLGTMCMPILRQTHDSMATDRDPSFFFFTEKHVVFVPRYHSTQF